MEKLIKRIKRIPAAVMLAGLLFSCTNDLDNIKSITFDPSAPDEIVKNLKLEYIDSGYVRVEVFAKWAERFSNPEQITKLKEDVKVHFYDSEGEIVSILTAKYAEIAEPSGKMLVRDSVILRNFEKKQQLETDELNWYQKDSSIYTNKNVLVRSEEGVLYGKGIRTKQDFKSYVFLKPYGNFLVK